MQLLRIRTSLFEEAAPVPADTIMFAATSVSKVYGDAAFVNALTNTGDGTVTFSSSDTSVATVNASTGQVTIVKAGNATITATVADGATSHYDVNTASYTLSVAKATRTLTFTNPTTQVDIGGTVTNVATVSTGASDGTLTYSSSNTSYATVNDSGVVTGVAAGSVTITATISGGTNYQDATSSYSMTVESVQPVTMEDFDYTGSVQSLTVPAGTYKLECWGAQGGSLGTGIGGKGGYSVGTLTLTGATALYVYVGGSGKTNSTTGFSEGGFNGGGSAYATSGTYTNGSGGGASDIRIGTDSLYARVIVAGGGGGFGRYSSAHGYFNGGYGGGATGGDGAQYDDSAISGKGGTQISAGDSYYGTNKNSTSLGTLAGFGVGGGAISGNTSYRTVGGGGGWYGGGFSQRAGAGGGSGFVWTGSNAPSGYLLGSTYYLSNASTTAGNASMPTTSGGTETGHEGNGHVRITKMA